MGGKNTRMGGNVKGLLKIGELTFLEHLINNTKGFYPVYLSINNNFNKEDISKFKNMGFDIIQDIYEGIGPLGGIYSSMKKCSEDYLFVTACDMPFINNEFIKFLSSYLKEDVDIVLCCDKDKRLYPLGAIYSTKLLPIMEKMIESSEYKLAQLIYSSNYVIIPMEGTKFSEGIFTNINTLEDYELFIKNEYKYN